MKNLIEQYRELAEEALELANKATPGPWLWGDWDIFDEDREAQKKGFPYWTLVEGLESYLCVGPYGRKTMGMDSILMSTGLDSNGIEGKSDDQKFIAKSRTILPNVAQALLRCCEENDRLNRLISDNFRKNQKLPDTDLGWATVGAYEREIAQLSEENTRLKAERTKYRTVDALLGDNGQICALEDEIDSLKRAMELLRKQRDEWAFTGHPKRMKVRTSEIIVEENQAVQAILERK